MVGWQLTIEPDGENIVRNTTSLELCSSLGDRAWLELRLASQPESDAFRLGAPARIHVGAPKIDDAFPQLRLTGASYGVTGTMLTAVAEYHYEDASVALVTSPPGVLLLQRAENETAWSFLSRVGERGLLSADIDPGAVDPERLDAACPVGWTFVVPAGTPPRERLRAVFEALAGRAREIAGLARRVARPESLPVGLFVNEGEEEKRLELDPALWSLGPSDREDAVTLIRRDNWPDPLEALAQLLDPESRQLGNNGKSPSPIMPGVVKLASELLLVVLCRTRVLPAEALGADDRAMNVITSLTAVPWRRAVCLPAATADVTLVGVVSDKVALPERTVRVGLVPPERGAVADLPPALAQWYLPPDTQALVAAQVTPGFARDSGSAFYARWWPGDLACFAVGAGGTPVCLGGLRRREPALEGDNAAQVALVGAGILLRAHADGKDKATFHLGPDGGATLEASSATITAELSTIRGDLMVKGDLDVA